MKKIALFLIASFVFFTMNMLLASSADFNNIDKTLLLIEHGDPVDGEKGSDGSDDTCDKVTICHRTGSSSNPYNIFSVDESSIINDLGGNGHGTHEEDIIPPFVCGDVAYPGQNWDQEGISVWNNGCSIPDNCTGTISIAAKVMLQGPFDITTTNMRVDLTNNSLLPMDEPYSNLGYSGMQNTGYATTLSIAHNQDVVDWVVLELRAENDTDENFKTYDIDNGGAMKVGLLQKSGEVVDVDGSSPVVFMGMSPGNYHIIVRHRNHLGVSSNLMTLGLDSNSENCN